MERLGSAQNGCQGLKRRPHDVVHRLLGRKRAPRGLRMTAELSRPRIVGAISTRHLPGPKPAGRSELGDFFEEVIVHIKKEGQLRSEAIHRKTGLDPLLHVRQSIVQGKGQLLGRGRTGLPNVVAADTDRVPFGYVRRAVRHRVGDETERRFGREQPFLLGDIFFQDVIL